MNIKSTSAPLVSFLTVNYHQREVTLALVNSLSKLSYPNWECIVVNNHEQDLELESALRTHKNVKVTSTNANLGFAGGNNVGLEFCRGEYIYFINNDVEVEPYLLEPILEVFENNANIGMVSSKIVYFHDKTTIQYAGATELNKITTRNTGIGHGEKDEGQYDDVRETAFVHGASMVVPKVLIDEIGPMYDDFFLYYEEYDWCERFKQRGYEIIYCGLGKVYHKESVSTGVNSPLKVYYLTRNRLLFARRNYSMIMYSANWFYFTTLALPKGLIKHMIKGEFAQAKAMLKGYFWNFYSAKK
ncbi:glycosyltransferase family 2 protein [Owenweeksia hongkongensis]|uniref:glycosyltransferase family 2 protein n=1 Tax=Owenweeksia hongkongensis TaxID=253245 RepID=UPI003A9565EC